MAYEKPVMEVLRLEKEDIIRVSGGGGSQGGGYGGHRGGGHHGGKWGKH